MNESNHGSNTGSIGRLMSPSEVREATQGRTDLPENMKTQWYLCGDVPEDVWNKLISCADEAAFRITSFTTPNRTAYVVFTMQIDDAQIRFLLPLGKSRETQFLSDANRSGVLVSLAKDNSRQALIREFALQPGTLAGIAADCRPLPQD